MRGQKRKPSRAKLWKFTLEATDEWRSMILFGLYSGHRLGDIATLIKVETILAWLIGELRFSVRKTDKTMILPLANPSLDSLFQITVHG
jgi:hypothetical protein